MWIWGIGLLTFGLAWALTYVMRRYALAKNVLDVPNARSSHSRPTPRGGGVAFVVAFVLWGGVVLGWGLWPVDMAIATLGSGLIIAVTGFVDDHHHIAARWRLLAHFFAAAWALYWLGGAPPVIPAGLAGSGALIVSVAATFFLVWMLNLYNFMDGIDGIASVEAITVCVGGALLYIFMGYNELSIMPLLLAAAVGGFLVWNFPPARIFMGDAGSGFLGVVLGVMALQAGWVQSELFWAWLILLGVFIVDATYTLARRLARRERVYEAHRSHAYQAAARRFGGHLPVTLGVLCTNVFWLWPLAYLAATKTLSFWLAIVVAYLPLIGFAMVFQAGKAEKSASI